MPLWRVKYSERARRVLDSLDKTARERIERYMDHLVDECPNPKARGKPLSGNRAGQWRYRVGDYRVICELRDNVLVVLMLEVEHRSKVY